MVAAQPAAYYFDSSALIKRYALETGTDWITTLCANENDIRAIANIGLVEIAAALSSKQRGGFLTSEECDRLLVELAHDTQDDYLLIAVDDAIVHRAITLTRRHKLRGYDAVHLACALALQQILASSEGPPLILVVADHDLLKAAAAEGLVTENPDDHS